MIFRYQRTTLTIEEGVIDEAEQHIKRPYVLRMRERVGEGSTQFPDFRRRFTFNVRSRVERTFMMVFNKTKVSLSSSSTFS